MTEEQMEVLEAYKKYQSCRLTETELITTLNLIDYKYTKTKRTEYLRYVDKLFEITINKNKN